MHGELVGMYGPEHWDAARLLIFVARRLDHFLDARETALLVKRWPTPVAIEATMLLGLRVQPWVVIDVCDALADALDDWAQEKPF